MKILLHYLKPHKWLVTLVLTLAAINIGFSLVDPILFGKLVNLANDHMINEFNPDRFFNSFSWDQPGVWFIVMTYPNLFHERMSQVPYYSYQRSRAAKMD